MTNGPYKALIIDDEEDICELIEMSFFSINIECTKAYTVNEAIIALQSDEFDVCFTDLKLPDGNGFEILQYIHERKPNLPVAMMTAHGNVESAIEAMKLGAFDFISKPFKLEHLRTLALNAIKAGKVINQQATLKESENQGPGQIRESISSPLPSSGRKIVGKARLYGQSARMAEVRSMIARLARSEAPVYINGESGTGKELAARAIHEESGRVDGPFIAVNCGAIPEQLVESEFFGHKKGSFTGANRDKEGLFEAANEGTLFLDEVADLPLQMQVKLLRAIQERAVRPVGGTTEVSFNARLISASHKNLQDLVYQQLFRQDLFYRLNVITLNLPSLRERLDDLLILSEHLLERINQANNSTITISTEALNALSRYHFPGNVRELDNILERAAALCLNNTIQPDDLGITLPHHQEIPYTPFSQAPKDYHTKWDPSTPSRSNQPSRPHDYHHAPSSPISNPQSPERYDSFTPSEPPSTHQQYQAHSQAHFQAPPQTQSQEANQHNALSIPRDINDIDHYLESIERKILLQALGQYPNKTEAAKGLGISFRQLRYRLKKHNIEDD